jgi:hypothetical protein
VTGADRTAASASRGKRKQDEAGARKEAQKRSRSQAREGPPVEMMEV